MSYSKLSMSTSSGTPSINTQMQSQETETVVNMTIMLNRNVHIGSKIFQVGTK